MNNDTTLEKVGTDRLRPGDVLVDDRPRLVIDRPIDTISLPTGTVFRTCARIDNWSELVDDARANDADGIVNSAAQFITRRTGHDDEHRWTIQGNAMATWWRETTPTTLPR
ncbi:hypothetical protein [Nocardia salmonicida]|uniref:hypothetical protein n=1 Tax=Nocardia salmonicida TaxID=53431 RepID=UPI0007A38717|nr:hypothetical protein [Nocardia salmonicida]MBC7299432.1 hypothetical protein [Nocardia sp.]